MSVLAVINPVAGDRSASAFFTNHIAPKLSFSATTTEQNAAELIANAQKPVTVVVLSGDGTLHEIINALPTTDQVSFVLVPCGTANALYASLFPPAGDDSPSYKLKSLQAFLDGKTPVHLSLATTTISAPTTPPKVSIASVVVSTGLHASILHDSEALREQHPGMERSVYAFHPASTRSHSSSDLKWLLSRTVQSGTEAPSSSPPHPLALSKFTIPRLNHSYLIQNRPKTVPLSM